AHERPAMIRTGIGYDVHAFAPGRRLVLGGVEIPHPRGLLGHSDADVLTHAIADALLGCVAAGDIGHHFPNTDPRWAGVSSLLLLRELVKILPSREARPVHVDAMLIAEEPKVMPPLVAIRTTSPRPWDCPSTA